MNARTIIAAATLAVVGAGMLARKYYKTKADLETASAFFLRFSNVNLHQGEFTAEKIADGKWSVEYSTDTEVYSRHVTGINDPELDVWITMLVLKYSEEKQTAETAALGLDDFAPVMEYVEFKKTTMPALWADVTVTPATPGYANVSLGEKSTVVEVSSIQKLDQVVKQLHKEEK